MVFFMLRTYPLISTFLIFIITAFFFDFLFY
nr:MAG TPA: hypothetical protein [Caudoviricetes sp.]